MKTIPAGDTVKPYTPAVSVTVTGTVDVSARMTLFTETMLCEVNEYVANRVFEPSGCRMKNVLSALL
ncbi:MAG: hypothetical protein DMD74_09745 [Gemmatimonadetes bacterium]|nr:MAG: hypothetical protein DMD74_09745 [Gemmatimonadota bacterium]